MSEITADHSYLLRSAAELELTEARRQKAEKTKSLGSPIQLTGNAIDIQIRGNYAWIAESAHVAKKIDLETGKTLQIYRGHHAPVTCLAFYDRIPNSGDEKLLITGSWDKTIKIWDTNTKGLISTTAAHDDFVKTLLVVPSVKLLVSSSSDKIVKFWDLTDVLEKPPQPAGSVSAHSRPVECIAGIANADGSVTLFTADTMGVLKVWKLEREGGPRPRWRSTLQDTLNHHRTRITEIIYDAASSDETVQVVPYQSESSDQKPIPPLTHPLPVRAILPLALSDLEEPYIVTGYGDVIRLYDVSTPSEPEVLGEIDAHWHDVTALRLWVQKSRTDDGRTRIEPWIISASLDGTIRRWRFSELHDSKPDNPAGQSKATVIAPTPQPSGNAKDQVEITEEEERELAELMEED
ncbi:WD40-repeat-containing domain protein [Suillus discolor]|uniref:WD40-repeat-containing domain protein n=1 Tax=Suillus discolor TaxID=1912936 RepID=A0A9P7JXW6_9AGAM|nr:WD40-repeat-containing domain protein [Suillus discolor]KAG2115173.1 WD40-repeat-containing domain protein [Suillus discolor]